MSDRVLDMAEIVRRSISEKDECPIVIDLAGFCLSTLEPSERRIPAKMLECIYDWCRGIWQNGVNPGRENRPAYLLNASLAGTFANGSKPAPIVGDAYAAAMLCAALPAAFGIKTRLAFGGNGHGWEAVWAEAKTGEKVIGRTEDNRPIIEDVFGAHMDLYGGRALNEAGEYREYGTADIFNGWIATRAVRSKEPDSLDALPPAEGEHFFMILPDNWEGIKVELRRMRSYVRDSVADPLVVSVAQEIMGGLTASERGDYEARLAAVYAWIRERFIYRPDPIGTELIQSPQRMIRMTQIDPRIMGAILAPVYAARAGVSLAEIEVVPATSRGSATSSFPSPFYADCDEAALMAATIPPSEPIGIPTEFAFGGTYRRDADGQPVVADEDDRDSQHHVWVRAQINGIWGFDMDPTELDFESVGDHAEMEKGARMSIWGRR